MEDALATSRNTLFDSTNNSANLNSTSQNDEDRVRVVVRCRPLAEDEKRRGANIVDCSDVSVTLKCPDGQDPPRSYTFDAVFGPDADQLLVYNVAARGIVENVLKGYNGCVFVYGQTGTGKTYTMSGEVDVTDEDVENGPVSSARGIIPNSFAHLFDHIAKCAHDTTFLVRVSYLEIYNEELRDLLCRPERGQQPPHLEVRERPDRGVFVHGLSAVTVASASHMLNLMKLGNRSRSTASTAMNETSSRSHAIFTVTVEMASSTDGRLTQGKLQLVDLAGSERQSKTGATGGRLKEAASINLSLSTLGNVISALTDAKTTHVPYRNSKLTRLLQDSLGGNSRTVMVACVGPSAYNYDETLSTLRYAHRAKRIQNAAKINEDPKDALLRRFQQELEALRAALADQNMDDTTLDSERDEDGDELRREMESTEDAEERAKLRASLAAHEHELAAVREKHANLRNRLKQMENKLIVGGENLLDKAAGQAEALEKSNAELERSRAQESRLRSALVERKAERDAVQERFNSLQEESTARAKTIRKLVAQLAEARAELDDVQRDHQREVEALLEHIRRLRKELLLQVRIADEWIPGEYLELIEKNVHWHEEVGEWQLRAIALAGNNIRRPKHSKRDENKTESAQPTFLPSHDHLYDSFRAHGLDVSKSREETKAAAVKREREAAKLRSLLN